MYSNQENRMTRGCPMLSTHRKSWKLGNKFSMCWLLETSRNDENFNATNGGPFVKIERQNFWFFFIPLATIKRITSNRCWFKTTQKFYDRRIMNCWTLEKTIINFYIISLFFRSQYVILLSTTAGGLKSARGSSIFLICARKDSLPDALSECKFQIK